MRDANLIRTLRDYSKPNHEGYRNTIELSEGNNVVSLRSDTIRRTIDQSADGKLRDRNTKESWALLEDLALYDNESWNDPRDFAKPVKAISLPQDVPMVPTTLSSASSRTDEAGGWVSNFMASQDARLLRFEADFKQQQSEMTNKIDTVLKAITDRMTGALPSDTVKNPKLNVNSTSPVLSARSYPTEDPQCSTQIHGSINAITICPKRPGKLQNGKPKEEEQEEKEDPKNINTNPSSPPDPSVSFITKKVCKLNSFFESLGLVPQSSNIEFVCIKGDDDDIEQYNSLSDLKKQHTKSVYLRNGDDKRSGVEYVMSKILGFYKECLELGPEYVTGITIEGEVTLSVAT
ncbi:hypothetical protein Tco_1530756 [Tanacetum coccineum]